MDFTVIVPTYERPDELAGCVAALVALDYPHDRFEIVVVDDGGSADLGAALEAGRGRVPIILVHQRNLGPGAARNAGAAVARGQALAFTDDDCRPQPGWLRGLRRALESGPRVLAGGRTSNQLRTNRYAETSQLILEAAYRYFNRDRGNGRFLASNNMAVDRAEFLEVGGFDVRFRIASEDRDLCDRWVFSGGRIVWTDEGHVEHRHVLTFAGFVRQHYAYGRGAARYHRMRRARRSGRLWQQLSFHGRWGELLIRPALASPAPARVLLLLACWQAANTAGFLRETLGKAWPGD